jgi:sec-independent protein translocase protein TatC
MGDSNDKNPVLDGTMSLGDHLEELRARLIMALIGLAIGSVICLCVGKKIIRFIQKPYNSVIAERLAKSIEEPNALDQMTLVDSFGGNLIKAILTDPNAPDIDPNTILFVHRVYDQTLKSWSKDPNNRSGPLIPTALISNQHRLQTLAPADAFIGYMKISMVAGLLLSSPWVFYHIWMFIAAGLYANERKYVRIAVPFSVTLFVVGALFFLFVVAPLSLRFFLTFGDILGVAPNWTFQKYISFVTILMLVFGVAFQTPIAIYILTKTGLVSIQALRSSRKFVFLGVFVIAAVVTPPDVVSQITLALPLYALFELGIVLSAIAGGKKDDSASTP